MESRPSSSSSTSTPVNTVIRVAERCHSRMVSAMFGGIPVPGVAEELQRVAVPGGEIGGNALAGQPVAVHPLAVDIRGQPREPAVLGGRQLARVNQDVAVGQENEARLETLAWAGPTEKADLRPGAARVDHARAVQRVCDFPEVGLDLLPAFVVVHHRRAIRVAPVGRGAQDFAATGAQPLEEHVNRASLR